MIRRRDPIGQFLWPSGQYASKIEARRLVPDPRLAMQSFAFHLATAVIIALAAAFPVAAVTTRAPSLTSSANFGLCQVLPWWPGCPGA